MNKTMENRIQLRVATPEDVKRFYGETTQYSCRAIVAELNGELVGLGGVYRVQKVWVVFTEIRDAMKPFKKDIVRAAKMVLTIINKYPTVIAYKSKDIPSAGSFAKHFGFENTETGGPNGEMLVRVKKNGTTE